MATITLKNGSGQTLAKAEDDAVELVDTGQEATVDGKQSKLVQVSPLPGSPDDTPSVTAWVPEDELSEFNVRTVSIPQNFAGMEAIAVPTRLRPQLFDIVEVVENEEYVEITALHMFYRLSENMTLWKPTEGLKYTGAAACRNVMTNQLSATAFRVASDCTDERPGDEMDYERRNIVETFLDPESGICARYDLSMIRDNDVFYCLKNVGYDRGFLIENGKNLLGVERRVNIENLVTRVAPVGRDEEGEYVWLNRNGLKYVDSSHIGEYPAPRAEIYYTDITIGENGVTAENIQQKLYEEALTRFSIDEADIPEVTMTIQFVSLGDTEEYAQYRDLDKVYLYDILTIKDTVRGYNYAAQVVGVEHNILTGRLESVTIGHLTETDGTRKVATWKVPEINGHKVRHKTIRSGSYEKGSIHTDDIADAAVTAAHMSQSADGHFKTIFAEELYISNTSEDGLLHTEFSVTQGQIDGLVTKTGINNLGQNETLYGNLNVTATRVGMVVGTVQGTDYIKAAEIAVAINQSTGQSEARINASHVYIGNEQSTTVIAGKCALSDVTATYITGEIAKASLLSVQALSSTGGISAAGFVSGDSLEGNSLSLGGKSCTDLIKSASASNGVLTLTYLGGGTVTFNGAASVDFQTEGLWSSGSKTLTLTNGKTHTVNIPNGDSWSGTYIGIQSQVPTMAVSVLVGGKSIAGTVDATGAYNAGYDAGTTAGYTSGYSAGYAVGYVAGQAAGSTASYNNGWNGALTACGIAGGGTVYTGTWYGTLYVAPTGGATPINNCVGQATAHTVDAK